LLADERCGARVGFTLLQSFAKYLLLGRQGHSQVRGHGSVELSGSAALISDTIALLHFTDHPMQQARRPVRACEFRRHRARVAL
jgi:hypothetical protein